MKAYTFVRKGREWFIDLPEYLEQGGSEGDLQMVDGADTMLDIIAGTEDKAQIMIAAQPFEGADKLLLTEKCDPYIGGGSYFLEYFNGNKIAQTIWLCQVTEFVFGDIPDQIFFRNES